MPRTYVKKRSGPNYTLENVISAVNDVQNKNCSYRAAAEQYGVPISVIYNRINGRKTSIDKLGAGRSPVFNPDIEKTIANCLIARSQIGYPCDKGELKSLVAEYVKANKIQTPFKDNIPGEDWYQAFMRRNPNISLKRPELLQKARKTARDPFIVYDFYEKLESLYKNCNLEGSQDAGFIFNCDESGFSSDPSKLRAIGEKGQPINRISGGSGRESTTVLFCVSADGSFLPPLIVFKGAAVQARWTSTESYPGTLYAATKNGWMEEQVFYNWFKNSFVPCIKRVREEKYQPNKTAVLIYDGHLSHISLRIIEEAIENNIQLFRLPSHLTDKIQPLDKCVFGPIKIKWDKKLVEYGRKQMGEGSGRLPKNMFGVLLGQVLREAVSVNIVTSGFASTGIFPLNSSKFPTELFDPYELQKYNARKRAKSALCHSLPSLASTSSNLNSLEDAPGSEETPTKIITSTSVYSSPEVESAALDLSLKINRSPRDIRQPLGPRSIVDIFANVMHTNRTETKSVSSNTNKTVVPRLKQTSFGEVLTAPEILSKLRQAETEKQKKKGTNRKCKNAVKKTRSPSNEPTGSENETLMIVKQKLLKNGEKNDLGSDDDTDLLSQMEIENTPEVAYEDPKLKDLVVGTYILVDVLGGNRNKTHYAYACVITAVLENNEYSVTGLKSVNTIKTSFVMVHNDNFTIQFCEIKAILPIPSTEMRDRKLFYTFDGSVAVNEKK